MGAILAVHHAARHPDDVFALALYAPTLQLDGWGIPWYGRLFDLVHQKWFADLFQFAERDPWGIKDRRLRELVKTAITERRQLQGGHCRAAGRPDAGAALAGRGHEAAGWRRAPADARRAPARGRPRQPEQHEVPAEQPCRAGRDGRARRQLPHRHAGPAAPRRGGPDPRFRRTRPAVRRQTSPLSTRPPTSTAEASRRRGRVARDHCGGLAFATRSD